MLSAGLAPRRARWRRWSTGWFRNPAATFATIVLVILIAFAIAPSMVAPYDPIAIDPDVRQSGPTMSHIMGTDELGRDIFSRVIHGSRTAMHVGLGAVAIAMTIGTTMGVAAGYRGGFVDELVMRVVDAFFAFPAILLAVLVIAAIGGGTNNVAAAIGIVLMPAFARLARGSTLATKRNDYVAAARALGCGPWRVIVRHIMPNIMAPIIVQASLAMGFSVIAEASLAFLGIGTQPPDPSWGLMLRAAQRFLATNYTIAIFPGMIIVVTVLAFNFLGDAIRDLADPRLRGR